MSDSLERTIARLRPFIALSLGAAVGGGVWYFSLPSSVSPSTSDGNTGISIPFIQPPKVTLEKTRKSLGNNVLRVRGSTSVAHLTPLLTQKAGAEGVTIDALLQGTEKGVEAVLSGGADVAFASAKPEQPGVAFETVGADHIGLFVGKDAPFKVASLSKDAACRALSGDSTALGSVGGSPQVQVIDRDKGGTRKFVHDQCGGKVRADLSLPDGTTLLTRKLETNPNAVGYGSMGQVQGMVRAIPVDGFERPIYLVFRPDSPAWVKAELVPFIRQSLTQVQ